ncbi:MAG: integrase arm-type DNA-binding domain-containing protein [Betaproteobacteria bacterium]|nr:integrase arm-type DNA-binding domain-containing protein [Betaproteobacteria bacterium]
MLPSGAKSWRLKYRHSGKEKTYTIGPYPEFGLKAARDKRDEARAWLREGIDPTAQKHALRKGTTAPKINTFAAVAADYLKAQSFSEQHFEALNRILDRDLNPELGALPVADSTTPQVLDALRTIEARGQLETCAKATLRLAGVPLRHQYRHRQERSGGHRWRVAYSSRPSSSTASPCR